MKRKKVILTIVIVTIIGVITAGIIIIINSKNKTNDHIVRNVSPEEMYEYTTNTRALAKGNDGYYLCEFKRNSELLMFFDPNQNEAYPVCGKADCKHNNADCNAYFDNTQYLLETVYYYNESIYMFKLDKDEGTAILTRVSSDGSQREEISEIMPNNNVTTLNILFYGNCAYIYDSNGGILQDNEHTESIIEVSLDKKTKRSVYDYTGNKSAIINGRIDGTKLYFMIMEYVSEGSSYSVGIKGLYAYDFESGKTDLIYEGNISSFFIDNKKELYVVKRGEGLFKINLDTKEEAIVYAANEKFITGSAFFDGNYIYLCNKSAGSVNDATKKIESLCIVIDKDGKEVDEIAYEGSISFADKDYLFDFYLQTKKYIKKSEIGKNPEWTKINFS